MEISQFKMQEYKKEYKSIKESLDDLAKRKQEARAEGDLSENTEYEVASLEYSQAFTRMMELEDIINNAVVVDTTNSPRIGIGDFVRVKCLNRNIEDMVLLVDAEGDPLEKSGKNGERVLGINSILGKTILNCTSREYEIQAPGGIIKFKVEKLKHSHVK